MKCQNCNINEAELTISFQHKDNQWEIHLCEECAEKIRRFTDAAFSEFQEKIMRAGVLGGYENLFEEPLTFLQMEEEMSYHDLETDPKKEEKKEEIRIRRRRNQLRFMLEEAIRQEAYEEAAELRDSLKRFEEEHHVQ